MTPESAPPAEAASAAAGLTFASAAGLTAALRQGRVGALELLEHYLARVERHNPALNAIIFMQEEAARERARSLDEALARGEAPGPLHGLPMTIKESFDWVGSPTTWGVPALKDNYAKRNALAVDRLLDAGAVIFGKTNVPIYIADWQSFNDIYGVTNNPWDLALSPGGSSGGAAAALAAGLVGLELGSDIGGSVRNPAHCCGLFGLKPTYGIAPTRGQALPGVIVPADISAIGPLARSAEDLALALDVIAGPDELDGAGWRLELPAARKTRIQDFKVAVMLSDPNSEVDAEYADLLQGLADKLARAGAEVSDTARPDIDTIRAHWVYIALLRAATSRRQSEADFARSRELAAALDPEADDYTARMLRANTMSHRDWLGVREERGHMRLEWAAFFEDYDLLLCPAAASAARPHDHAGERHERTIEVNGHQVPSTDALFWAGISSVVYLPAAVAPVGLTRSGLPAGVQIVGPHLGDRTCIEFARLLEETFGGFTPPPGYAD